MEPPAGGTGAIPAAGGGGIAHGRRASGAWSGAPSLRGPSSGSRQPLEGVDEAPSDRGPSASPPLRTTSPSFGSLTSRVHTPERLALSTAGELVAAADLGFGRVNEMADSLGEELMRCESRAKASEPVTRPSTRNSPIPIKEGSRPPASMRGGMQS